MAACAACTTGLRLFVTRLAVRVRQFQDVQVGRADGRSDLLGRGAAAAAAG